MVLVDGETPTVKLGTLIINVTEVMRVTPPPDAVIVSGYVWAAIVESVVMLSVTKLPVVEAGEKVAVASAGRPVTPKVTEDVNPATRVNVKLKEVPAA